MDKFKEKFSKRPASLKELKNTATPGQTIVAAGMVEGVRVILTRGGDQMAFVKICDYDDQLEAVVFPKNFVQYRELLKPDTYLAMKGRLSNRNGELSMVAEALKAL
jgi:DNA polymerase-3 subunit alpha